MTTMTTNVIIGVACDKCGIEPFGLNRNEWCLSIFSPCPICVPRGVNGRIDWVWGQPTPPKRKKIKLKLKSKPKPPKRKKIKLKLVKPKPKQGRLAKVSVYEFVNDWLPEQLRSKIMAYAISDPHKEGIIKAQTHRRIHWSGQGWCRQQWTWSEPFNQRSYDIGFIRSTHIPYNKIRFYDFDQFVVNCCQWADEYEWGKGETRRAINLRPKMAKLKHTNPLLYELWSLHLVKSTDDPFKFIITKKQLTQLLKDNKVKGRSDLMFGCQCSGATWQDTLWVNAPNGLQLPPPDRRKAVKALMSI